MTGRERGAPLPMLQNTQVARIAHSTNTTVENYANILLFAQTKMTRNDIRQKQAIIDQLELLMASHLKI